MSKEVQKILTIGGSGGEITLYCYHSETTYYWLETSEVASYDMLDEAEKQGIEDWIQQRSNHVVGWELGIGLMERYPWWRLYPVYINPAYKEQVLEAYLKESPRLSWQWKKAFGRD